MTTEIPRNLLEEQYNRKLSEDGPQVLVSPPPLSKRRHVISDFSVAPSPSVRVGFLKVNSQEPNYFEMNIYVYSILE
jgi:hypothetical protein